MPSPLAAASTIFVRWKVGQQGQSQERITGTLLNVATLSVNGKEVARKQIRQTVPYSFHAAAAMDVGMDGGSAVATDYMEGNNTFKGRLNSVRIDLK